MPAKNVDVSEEFTEDTIYDDLLEKEQQKLQKSERGGQFHRGHNYRRHGEGWTQRQGKATLQTEKLQ